MNLDRINDLINKLPLTLLLVAYLGYLGYDYYEFTNSDQSPLVSKRKEIETAKANAQKAQAKLKDLDRFVKGLETKKVEIRQLALDLQETKSSIPERSDVPGFMKALITEAKRSGLKISGLRPGESSNKEFYSEQHYDLRFQGAYSQVLAFMDRISNMSDIIQIDSFQMKPVGSALAKFVNLDGSIDLKTFSYLGTKEDKIGTNDTYTNNSQGVGSSTDAPKDGQTGGKK
ncbi:MAG: type 4a pilus biogenesis protein PilO [Bdellovibrio sp.]|nr:type 4a pilus biogenesis protein PilO [Bdellovibrio sp.]